MDQTFDIAIIGGGINGSGIARDAAGRGLKVYLCEQSDLASGTSSASTKLIHGGLRYLEYYEFRLVREALMEREVLWGIAPHIIWPLRFVLPHHSGLRPAWLLRLGLFLYDHLGGRKLLPPTKTLSLGKHEAGKPLKPGVFSLGFEYSDCWVQDARLVTLNAVDARERGVTIRTRTRALKADRVGGSWRVETENVRTGERETINARVLVNAAGPWVDKVLGQTIGENSPSSVRLVQGSHIVVPKLYDHDRCYIFQNSDNRIVFAIPYETDFTLIGTTDRDYGGDPSSVHATGEEVAYLCNAASEYFAHQITPEDVVWTYSGVRPLYDDGKSAAQSATRDYVLELSERDGAPLLSIFGGKITTYRRLAQHALDKLAPFLPKSAEDPEWTGKTPLPGGDFPAQGFDGLVNELAAAYPWAERKLLTRLARAYGTRTKAILANANDFSGLGQHFGAGLTAREVDYLMREEWAIDAADVVWRRSKIGLRLSSAEIDKLELYMKSADR